MWTHLWEIKAFWLKLLWRLFGEIHFTSPTFDCWCQLFYSSHKKSLVSRRNEESNPSLSLHKSSFRGLGSQGWKSTVCVMCNGYNKHFVWILIFNFIWVGVFLANDDHPLIFQVNGWSHCSTAMSTRPVRYSGFFAWFILLWPRHDHFSSQINFIRGLFWKINQFMVT